MKKNLIAVKAGAGLRVYFPTRVASAPGALSLVISGDEIAHVSGDDRFVIKRLRLGDLTVVKQTGKSKPKPKTAAGDKTEKR